MLYLNTFSFIKNLNKGNETIKNPKILEEPKIKNILNNVSVL